MRVAAKRQRHPRRYARKDVRLVSEQHHGVVCSHLRQRPSQIVDAAKAAMTKPMGKLIA